jgi:hypothetical protein
MSVELQTTIPSGSDATFVRETTGGVTLGTDAAAKIGFYGKAPVAQRAYSSAVHLSSELATSSAFGATQLAAVNEIQKTLVALGVWATA